MKHKLFTAGVVICFCLLLFGCENKDIVFETNENAAAYDIVEEAEEQQAASLDQTEEINKEDNGDSQKKSEVRERNDQPSFIVIHLCGAVKSPGVYEIEQGSRLYQVVELAGGFSETAEEEYLNLALYLEDGMQITVPTKEEVKLLLEERKKESFTAQTENGEKEEESGKVNINTADEKELCTLPGIGEGRAGAIIKYRTEQGEFKEPEEIMKVPGIKEAAFEKIKDLITVSR